MSHHIYNTKAFVIDAKPSKESDLLINLYTEDFGLISAVAQGVREMKSKLRYSLQELSFGTIALVRGREMWRITNASTEISLFNKALNVKSRTSLASILKFVKRFAPGEARNNDIFECLKQNSALLFKHQKEMGVKEIEMSELVTRLRLLYILGYIKNEFNNKEILTETYNPKNIKKWEDDREVIEKVIEEGVRISHL